MEVLSGLGVGLNAVRAEVFRVKPQAALPAAAKHAGDAAAEKLTLRNAISAVSAHLAELSEKAGETSAEIFEALTMLLEDEDLFDTAAAEIEAGWNAGTAFIAAVDSLEEIFAGDDAFMERLVDLKDLAKRVAAHIAGVSLGLDLPSSGRFVIVGEDFSPADTAQFTDAVVGVITIKGGPTSHTAIICRSKSIPAVVSCAQAEGLLDGMEVLVDPVGDRVVVGGDDTMITKAISFVAKSLDPIIPVRANIGSLEDSIQAATTAANGVGLFRTELLYLSENTVPSRQKQTKAYTEILSAAPEGPIVVRTIDAGSDKPVPFLHMPHEENPALGIRGYRLITDHRDFLVDQLVSLEAARVASGREVWVMAPMIATAQEALDFAELARSSGSYKVGIMVETPSIAMALGDLSGKLDFISVGTNDLSQYLFAADRMNAGLGALLNPWQPALIRMLAKIAQDSEAAGVSSGVCGESASDPAFAVVLAGLGFKSVSASRSQVGAVRSALSSVTLEQAQQVAKVALSSNNAENCKAAVLDALAKIAQE
ncbi:phosphoenolpyruvate--protein phosphotransferase [Aquiluna borgnonia]|uniref:Phosphoenolpyruvate-protein phosphotransferase n=1 Tax=Aquiluna borgnonia TaxID=2499157 RepID=A0A7D4UJQ1_9MICO|nr:putative PEP-binding protein [Aquiluna borgnonia]QKJ24819.1 phosphoenolpyruvate--protein phosphotransferase [Aquiluna borgnonia]